MAKKTPTLREKAITFYQEDGQIALRDITTPRDHRAFVEIVATYKSFRFVAADGSSCSVVQELRPSFGNKAKLRPVWYAHKRLGGKLKRKYIGRAENLTHQKLKAVAFALCQRGLF